MSVFERERARERVCVCVRSGEVQGHKSEWLTPLAGGLVKTQLLVFTTLFTTLFCFLLRYLLRYGRRQRTTLMFFLAVPNASTGRNRGKETGADSRNVCAQTHWAIGHNVREEVRSALLNNQ